MIVEISISLRISVSRRIYCFFFYSSLFFIFTPKLSGNDIFIHAKTVRKWHFHTYQNRPEMTFRREAPEKFWCIHNSAKCRNLRNRPKMTISLSDSYFDFDFVKTVPKWHIGGYKIDRMLKLVPKWRFDATQYSTQWFLIWSKLSHSICAGLIFSFHFLKTVPKWQFWGYEIDTLQSLSDS